MKSIAHYAVFMRAIALFLLFFGTIHAHAQSVAMTGVMGSKALLVVGGGAPKTVGVGETHQGVRVVSVSGDQAVVEVGGKRSTVRVGDAPVSLGGGASVASSNKIVLPLGSGGHFFANGFVNGRAQQFMVDTGATTIGLGIGDAQRLGIDYKKGRPVMMGTANGSVQGYLVKLNSVRIGDVEVFEVDAVIGPSMPYALLGNSFLSRFSMNRTSDLMVLERRY
jgi:aspartyl protease family protein